MEKQCKKCAECGKQAIYERCGFYYCEKCAISIPFHHKCAGWGTPQSLFDQLDSEFHFTLDPCASHENHKCEKYFTESQNGLLQDWGRERVFCNPPYGRSIGNWVRKCAEHDDLAVMLIPARTDTKWFHEYIYKNPRVQIRFLPGRVKFQGAQNSAPFPSMVVVFNGGL